MLCIKKTRYEMKLYVTEDLIHPALSVGTKYSFGWERGQMFLAFSPSDKQIRVKLSTTARGYVDTKDVYTCTNHCSSVVVQNLWQFNNSVTDKKQNKCVYFYTRWSRGDLSFINIHFEFSSSQSHTEIFILYKFD